VLVYLTQLPAKKQSSFGKLVKDVLGVLPFSKIMETYFKNRDDRKSNNKNGD